MTELPPILLIGDAQVTESDIPREFKWNGFTVEIISASIESLLVTAGSELSGIISDADNLKSEEWLSLLSFKKKNPQTSIVLLANTLSSDFVKHGINELGVSAIIEKSELKKSLATALASVLADHVEYSNKNKMKRESSQQNKDLEALTVSLEEIVADRTQHIQVSNTELSEKLSRERQIIRFIKDVAAQMSIEDLLQVLRREFKKFHRTGEPILVYELQGGVGEVATFSAGRMHMSRTRIGLDNLPEDSVGKEMLVSLATLLGRPLAKALVFKLDMQLKSGEQDGKRAILCIEHSLQGKELNEFTEVVRDRIESLAMALDRILMENQLEKVSYRWAKTFDGVKDPVAIIDLDYNIIMANRNFGSKQNEQKKCYEVLAGQSKICEGCPLEVTLQDKQPQQVNLQVKNKAFRLFSYPVSANQEMASTTVVHQYADITEERLLYLNYIQNEKMSAIGALAGNIAHELNNPLSGIRSLAQVVLSEVTEQEPQLKKDLEEIEKAARRSQAIISNLLDFASGGINRSEDVGLDDVVEKTLPMLKTAMRMHRLHLELNSKSKRIHVEPHLLQQVIFNLVNNACQAMKEIGDLKISTRSDRGRVTLLVEDTGPGIPLEIVDKIFTPFFTTKPEGQGTGLGLSLVKSIIEKFGGVIEARNKPQGGAQFIVTLPAQDLR